MQEEAIRGGTLTVAVTNPCAARHPVDVAFNEEAELYTTVFETIVATDASGNLTPNLCERWEVLNDGAMFLFVLRKNIRFHDGRILTANEIKSAFEYAIRRSSQVLPSAFEAIRGVQEFCGGTTSDVKGITALSENIIQFQLTDRLPIYPALLTEPRTAVAIQSAGAGYEGAQLLGTGPFQLFAFSTGQAYFEGKSGHSAYSFGVPGCVRSKLRAYGCFFFEKRNRWVQGRQRA